MAFIDHSKAQSLWQVWEKVIAAYPDAIALHDPHTKPPVKLTYRDVGQQIKSFGAGLRHLGVGVGDKVALIADNSPRWLIADQGILAIGAANATRSSQAERQELLFILQNSDSSALVVENLATLQKLQPEISNLPIKLIILLSDETPPDGAWNFSQVLAQGTSQDLGNPEITLDTLATLIYTSGTSGNPKGVMLTHGNFLHQVQNATAVFVPEVGDRVVSILPTWHSFERTFEYYVFSQGITQIYSSIRTIKKDLREYQPQYMVAVPRLWESIYEGIQKQLGEQPQKKQRLIKFFLGISQGFIKARRMAAGLDLNQLEPSLFQQAGALCRQIALTPLHQLGDRLVYRKIREATGGKLRFAVTGGGSIAEYLEDFYEIIGIEILGGYGLTETSPVTHVRRPERNLRNADGQPLRYTETRIVDPETRADLPIGKRGLILLRGPQIMKGYYKNPTSTAKAIDPDGWFDTGDLGWVTRWQDLIITGRAKDTIVLTNGENIEPQPIEDVCLYCPYVDQIVLVGQDQKQIGALIVPRFSALAAEGLIPDGNNIPEAMRILDTDRMRQMYRNELQKYVQNRAGYTPNDRIVPIRFISEPLTIENGLLTQTYKIKRNVVFDRFAAVIQEMYGQE